MTGDPVEAVARAVLYEGYNLYPYRPTALKNRHRWTFGGVFPSVWSTLHPDDRGAMRTECLVRGGGDAVLDVRVRFLHIIARRIGMLPTPLAELPEVGEPEFEIVSAFDLDGVRHVEWEEAREREVAANSLSLAKLAGAPQTVRFAFPAERAMSPLRGADGRIRAVLIRTAHAVMGTVEIAAERLAERLYRVGVRIENLTPLADPTAMDRAAAQRFAFASTHTSLAVKQGAFLSLLDPPEGCERAAAGCRNEGGWPVLVGEEGRADRMLSAPIILYDYPKVAPESPGDLFDGCEIDEILTLRILTLTEAEKREMAAADPRTRALLERTEALSAEELAMLHGTFREVADAPSLTLPRKRAGEGRGCSPAQTSPFKIGDRVRLTPKSGGDIMDVVLRGQVAVVEAIERDFEGRVHVAVTVLGDPGRDLGMDRMPGHRFFFAPDEIEPLAPGTAP